jgi:hypothetical protein
VHKDTAEADQVVADEHQTEENEQPASEQLEQGNAETEERYPVENAAVRWEDAANQGDTSRGTAVYDTPWGRRELTDNEVWDFRHQGVTVTRVDDKARTSLDAEREELRKVELTNRDAGKTVDR